MQHKADIYKRKPKKKKIKWNQLVVYIGILGLLILTLFPFYLMLNSSVKYNMQIISNLWFPSLPLHFDNYINAFQQVFSYMLNSLVVTTGIVIGVIFVATLAGYTFVRFTDMPGRNVLFFIILSFMMVPAFLVLIPQFMVVSNLNMLNSYIVQILPPIGALAPMAMFLSRTFFEDIPESLFEAASMEGAGEFKILTHIVYPMSGPVIATIAIMNCVAGWNNYTWPLMTATDKQVKPVVLALQGIVGNSQNYQGVQLAGYVIASLPLIIFFSFATKPFISGLSSGAVKA